MDVQTRPTFYLFFVLFLLVGVLPACAPISGSPTLVEATLSGWKSYTAQDIGLSEETISAIAFDTQGVAWMGTDPLSGSGGGLRSFEGETWTTHRDVSNVRALAVDGQGRIWVGTFDGLSVFDGSSWKTYHSENSYLPSNAISAMSVDSAGRIWLGVRRQNVFEHTVSIFDGKTFTNFEPKDIGLPPGTWIEVIASDAQDRIWIGTWAGGVYVCDDGTWKTAMKAKSRPNTIDIQYKIEDLAVDKHGRVWIGTGGGLSVYNGEDWITYNPENSDMPFEDVSAVAVDAHDRVWVTDFYGAVGVLETDGTWTKYTPIQEATAGFSNKIMVFDPQGRLWIGSDEGLNVFTPPDPVATVERVLPTPMSQPPTPKDDMDNTELIFWLIIPIVLPALVLALVVFLRRDRPKPVRTIGNVICLAYGSILLGGFVSYYLLWLIAPGAELYNLTSFIALIAIIYFSWKRPIESGIVLIALSLPLGTLLSSRTDNLLDTFGMPGPGTIIFITYILPIIFVIVYLVAGASFLCGGLISRRSARNAAKKQH